MSKSVKKNLVFHTLHENRKVETRFPHFDENLKELEYRAAFDFIESSKNFNNNDIIFHVCLLEDAISQVCSTAAENRKILLLYFHNKNDNFANIFVENLERPEVREIVDKYFLLGWDVENAEYHQALIEALNGRTELASLVNFIESKICAALLIVPIQNSFALFSCLKSQISKKDFLETLKKAEHFFATENGIEIDLEKAPRSENDISSTKYQQIMLDMLGDRDYDNFDHFEFEHLKNKIGYALYGPPEKETGYDEKQKKKINFLFDIIVKQNNIFVKWKDRIIVSFIYNCIEPLPSEKQKRSKKCKDYNPNTDLTPVPIFIIRKCKNSRNPCRTIIDHSGRVYKTWSAYLTRNKLPECEMILPLNGRYQADENGNVILERHLSPACGIDVKVLRGADIANTAAGIISGGVFIAATIPAITMAPIALVAAGATGLGVGLYSLGRSAYTLYDRNRHKETLSFANSEARGAYFNIVAGSLSFAVVGANVAISQMVARGINIEKGAIAALDVIQVANLGASGISVVNSGYDAFDQWWNENHKPSLLTIIQLSSSILFFGHAVYNLRSAGIMTEETQSTHMRTLRDYVNSLRNNKYMKTFNEMMTQAFGQNNSDMIVGQTEIIKTMTRVGINLVTIFANTEASIRERIINAVVSLVMELLHVHPGCFIQLDKIFPGCDKFLRLFMMVRGFFQEMIDRLEEKYQRWLATKDPDFEEPLFPKLALDFSKRVIQLFNFVADAYFVLNNLTEAGLKELIKHFYTWFTKQAAVYEEYKQRKQKRIIHSSSPSKRTHCPDCGGVYYC